MFIKKVDFTINQLISSDIYVGYYTGNWNPMINFFLLGSYRSFNLFNLNYTYFMLKMSFNILNKIFLARGNLWVVYEKLEYFFKRITELKILDRKFKFLKFYNQKWSKGLISNSRHVIFIKNYRFPRAIFLPNIQNDAFVANEATIMNIPTFGIVDTNESPFKLFYSIPGNTKSIRSLYFIYLLLLKNAFTSRNLRRSLFWQKINKKLQLYKKKKKYRSVLKNKKVSLILYNELISFFIKKFIMFRFSNKQFLESIKKKPRYFSRSFYTTCNTLYKNIIARITKKKKKKYKKNLYLQDNTALHLIIPFLKFLRSFKYNNNFSITFFNTFIINILKNI